jgi:hypothetical protein
LVVRIFRAADRNCNAVAASSGGSADAVHVGGRLFRQVVIHHERYIIHIKAARCHICANESAKLARFKTLDDFIALLLAQEAR